MGSVLHKFKGSIAAMVTPMAENGQIDFAQVRQLVSWHLEQGSDGLVIIGTTGESGSVSQAEHLEVVATAIDQAAGRLVIITGCGATSTQKAVDLAKQLNQYKPDGFLCVTPYYLKPTQEGLYQHFNCVADACDAPLILYNVPGRTACDLQNETVVGLAAHENIVGLKDAVADIERFRALTKMLDGDFDLLSGDDLTAFDFIQAGGCGVISVTANVAPRAMADWCRLLAAGQVEAARQIFERLVPLHHALFVEPNPIPVKWVLAQLRDIPTGIRLPLTPPTDATQDILRAAINQCNLE